MGAENGLAWVAASYDIKDLYPNCKKIVVPYGSWVYRTEGKNSDVDFIAIVDTGMTGTEIREANYDVQIYNPEDFQRQLNDHKIHALEVWYFLKNDSGHGDLDDLRIGFNIDFQLDLSKLRHSLSEKASHSFVKAKKKIDVEKDYYIGFKSLFHSLRILNFGIQIATTDHIDFSAANHYWKEIIEAKEYNWQFYKDKYQPIYNALSTEFKKVAPK